ncbi:hypothetical protein SNE25_01690 [Mucilaginibacter sabulilitoris]|uniref:Outer membrane protein beta-barrel domain-containing protein n=1 Tax=Mucilaginibacter sabulilitoris TaxID=1173583 RepID=A0ABZ0TN98_9SPHI|nr:hypothetical protein [Mucilaginibacter sabulilitoris]WPU94236.1 hypothetical protein SNE25_01690 [Mucilaginibacter sabulilitoris]
MYKKILLVILSVITLQAAKAQTEKGSQNLGVTFGVSTANTKLNSLNFDNTIDHNNVKQKDYSISPDYSYFIADKLDIGVGLGYAYSNSKYNSDYDVHEQTGKSFTSIISLRKYFLFDNKIGIRTGPFLSYQKTKGSNIYPTNTSKYNSDYYAGGVSLDFVYYPTKNIGLAANLGNVRYAHQKSTGAMEGTNNSFNLNFTDNLALSVYYVFGK